MHVEFSGSFPDHTIFICKFLKLMNVLFIHETFLVYNLETFTNFKEVKHMIMIIAIIHISYLMRYFI